MRGRRTANQLWRNPNYHNGMCGVCRKRPREFNHRDYPSMCEHCRGTRLRPFSDNEQENRLNNVERQMHSNATPEQIRQWALETSRKINERAARRVQNLNGKLDPRIQALFNKQEK